VGLYAVQLAHSRGARVITTVSNHDIDFVKRTRRFTIERPGLRKRFGTWMSSSMASAVTHSSRLAYCGAVTNKNGSVQIVCCTNQREMSKCPEGQFTR
jgi:hypothetical protein